MRRRQPLPRLWMMTDERQGDGLFAAVETLPRGAGIVFRHYGVVGAERRRLFDRVRSQASKRGLLLMLGGDPPLASAWGADGSHGLARGKASAPHLLRSASVHNRSELQAATRAGADFIFVSPVFDTSSHPGAKPLGRLGFGRLASQSRMPVIALGGMSAAHARRLAGFNIYGWAAIDAWCRT